MRRTHSKTLALLLILILAIPIQVWGQPVSKVSIEKTLLAGDWSQIDAAVSTWLQNPEFQNQASAWRGYAALVDGDAAGAVSHFLKARGGRANSATTAWLESLARNYPDKALAQFFAGDALARKGDRTTAIARLDAAIKLQSDLWVARLARAILRANGGEKAFAIEDIKQLIETPLLVEALVVRALVRMEQPDVTGASQDLNRALEIAPGHAVAWNSLGILHARQNDWATAAKAFETAFKSAPDLVEAKANYQLAQKAEEQGTVVSERKRLTVFVTDFGIQNYSRDLKLFDDFGRAKAGSVVPSLPRQGQILIPMPSDTKLPRNAPEREILKLQIARGIIERIDSGNQGTYEVRIAQNVNKAGYFSPSRQEAVKQFGRAVYDALGLVKRHFEGKGTSVEMPAVVGSNGAFLLTETVPKLRYNPIDRAVLIDGRAFVGPTRDTYNALGGRLTVINTSGDAPASANMIANHEAAKALKRELPSLRLMFADPDPRNLIKAPLSNHLAAMQGNRPLSVKEFNGRAYTSPSAMMAKDLVGMSLDLHGPSLANSRINTARGSLANSPGGVSVGPSILSRSDGGRVVFNTGGSGTLKIVYTLFGDIPPPPKEVFPSRAILFQHYHTR